MYTESRQIDKYHEERRMIKHQLKRWRNYPIAKSFFYTYLDPHIRYYGVLMSEFRINFGVVDGSEEYKFFCKYDHENGRTFSVQVDDDVERLSFLKDGEKFKPICSLRRLLEKVLENYIENCPRPEVDNLSPELYSESTKFDPVLKKTSKHYVEAWKGFIDVAKFISKMKVSRTQRRKLVDRKQIISLELMNLLKHPLAHCDIRALNTFMWEIDLHSDFFEEPLKEQMKKENVKSILLKVRSSLDYPSQFPFIRVLSPRLLHDKLSMNGVMQDEFVFSSFRGLLKNLKLRMRYFKIDINKSCHSYLTYDEDLSRTEWKRMELYRNSSQFTTLNRFNKRYKTVSPIFHFSSPNESFESGNKIILPSTALNQIIQANSDCQYPLLFELKSGTSKTFAGVREFTAKSEHVVAPMWMLRGLLGMTDHNNMGGPGEIHVRCVSLPQCEYIRLIPHDPSFFQKVENYKLLLGSSLKSNFATLTIGDTIPLMFDNNNVFWMFVAQLRPENGVSITSKDLEIVVDPTEDEQKEIPKLQEVEEGKMKGIEIIFQERREDDEEDEGEI